MQLSLKLFATMALAALSACTAPQPKLTLQPLSVKDLNFAVDAFSDLCLRTLPNFDGFHTKVETGGLETIKLKGATYYHHPENSRLILRADDKEGYDICGIGFVGTNDIPAVSQKFLHEALRRTGGQPKRRLTNTDFHLAYHLRNGSVFAYAIEPKAGHLMHVFAITEPVPNI
ncbi:MAG: hypothetical protein BM558_02085 [Roseobacter sp. MedPE-SW]|nr:MAG: hypothetical protein BM558_02085 [Roseobacter sp. MedPE-SW]